MGMQGYLEFFSTLIPLEVLGMPMGFCQIVGKFGYAVQFNVEIHVKLCRAMANHSFTNIVIIEN